MLNKENIADLLINYAGNSKVDFKQFGKHEDDVRYLFGEFDREFQKLPTEEGEKEFDELIEKYAGEVFEIIGKKQKNHFEIRRNFVGTSESDIYNNYENKFSDYAKETGCNENFYEQCCFEDAEKAQEVFEKVKNEKTDWTKNIILVKITDNIEIDEDGEENYLDCTEEIIGSN